ncbi:MAG: PKD domain-containing protein, partial [Planctomycetaceae bacterium]
EVAEVENAGEKEPSEASAEAEVEAAEREPPKTSFLSSDVDPIGSSFLSGNFSVGMSSSSDFYSTADEGRGDSSDGAPKSVDFRNELEARRDDDDPTNDLTADEERFLARLIDTLEDTDTGSYELVMYVASSTSASDGIDNLQGREGVDTFEAGDDDDYTLITDLTGPTESEPGLEWTGTVDLTDRGGYSWSGSIDFGDETDPVNWTSSPGSTEISHTFANLGIYTVTVTITNDDGQSHESTLVLDVSEDSVEITELDINGGLENRSVVKTADIVFSDSTFAADLLANLTDNDTTNDQLRVERRDLAGNSLSTPEYLSLPASAFTVSGNTLTIDFGSLGIQQNGVFAIQVDTDRDFDFDEDDKEVRFHRLLADVNGDGEVDHTDYQKIRSAYRRPDRYTDADVDGDGIVGRLDLRIFNSLARTRFQDKLLFGRDALDD